MCSSNVFMGGNCMRILGIDPGYAIVGWGVVEYSGSHFTVIGYGAIQTPTNMSPERRLAIIYKELSEIIDKFKPQHMAVEELFFNTNITTGIKVAQARGVMLLCAEQKGVEIFEYTPLQVKQAVVGYGRAEKNQVINMVTMFLGLDKPPRPDDTADALAIAVCHAHSGASRMAKYYNQK